MIFLIIFTVISAFVIGVYLGVKATENKGEKVLKNQSKNLQIIETEYQNFLNYDGSVQQ